ncbi:Rossmann-like alpha/beta/alpha sandwich fold [Sesbania bispinosa]|nr:Rossmann-like alpha/beta/alpha sandwich fold [Sesbania bispinosa]
MLSEFYKENNESLPQDILNMDRKSLIDQASGATVGLAVKRQKRALSCPQSQARKWCDFFHLKHWNERHFDLVVVVRVWGRGEEEAGDKEKQWGWDITIYKVGLCYLLERIASSTTKATCCEQSKTVKPEHQNSVAMAVRVNSSLQNTLCLLNPSLLSLRPRASRLKLKPHLYSGQNPSRGALFCTCATTNGVTPPNDEPFVLTTPLYYVNAPPHMGSAYSTIAADAIARFQRLLGKKVIFITGTDEHGEKIATAAMAQGSTPRDHCDLISQAYKTLWKDLDISYDKFIRTTESKHEAVVKEFYSRVVANGDIYRADYEGLYCVNCEEYKGLVQHILCNLVCMKSFHLPFFNRKIDNFSDDGKF